MNDIVPKSIPIGFNQECMYAPLFDYTRFTGGMVPSTLPFFIYPVGMTCLYTQRRKSYLDTNMETSGSLGQGTEFYATELRFYCKGADRDRLIDGGNLQLRIGHRIYVNDSPLAKFPALYDTFPWDIHAKPELLEMYRLGLDGLTNKLTPLLIQSYQPFRVDVYFADPIPLTAPLTLGVILNGYLIRGR